MSRRRSMAALRNSIPDGEPVTEVNIIPVIDISLVLLVILFISAPMMSYPNLSVELPKAKTPESRDRIVAVTYTLKGELAVGQTQVDWQGLDAALKAEIALAPEAPIMLRCDKAIPYRIVQRLMTAAKNAGAKKVALGTDSKK